MYTRFSYIFFLSFILIMTSCGPLAKFTVDQEGLKAPSTVKFTNESAKADRYEWDFGDGKTSEEANPEHRYYLSGKYDVQLRAYKGNKVKITKRQVLIEAPEKSCLVLMETGFGDMLIELYDETPLHRDNFLKLAESGYYNDLLFHRVMDGFMIQGGDPQSRNAPKGGRLGTGGPPYQVPAEFNEKLVHVRGALAAARQPDGVNPQKKSSGSQFYIVHGNKISAKQLDQISAGNGIQYTAEQKEIMLNQGGTPFLDMEYTVFGRVLEGFEVIDAIAKVKRDKANRPEDDVKMKVTVIK